MRAMRFVTFMRSSLIEAVDLSARSTENKRRAETALFHDMLAPLDLVNLEHLKGTFVRTKVAFLESSRLFEFVDFGFSGTGLAAPAYGGIVAHFRMKGRALSS